MEQQQPDRSQRAYRPELDRETTRHDPAAAAKEVSMQELKIDFVCEERGINTGPGQITLRATGGEIWAGQPNGELRLNLVNGEGQRFFVSGQHYQLVFQPVAAPVAAGRGGDEDEKQTRPGAL